MINEIFSNAQAAWVRHDDYELRKLSSTDVFIAPAQNAKATIYSPIEQVRDMAIEAMNLGRVMDSCEFDEKTMMGQIVQFVRRYGFLGVMVEIPLNDNFFTSDETYFTPNPFFPLDEKFNTQEYMARFFPLRKPCRSWSKPILPSRHTPDASRSMSTCSPARTANGCTTT